MAKITFIDAAGHVPHGRSAGRLHGDGGGPCRTACPASTPNAEAPCACATCHVYIDEEWMARTGERQAMEEDMLDFAGDVRPNSRLSCQVRITADLDGLVVHTPESQG